MRGGRVAGWSILLGLLIAALLCIPGAPAGSAPAKPQDPATQGAFTGTQSCRQCHEKFYRLWAPSHHGTAMQDYSDAFAAANLTPQPAPLVIKDASYQAQVDPGQGWVLEKTGQAEKRHPIRYALGGKNIYYLLTPMDKGRLQTLPLAFDIKKKAWFDTAQSGIRHAGDQPVDWRDATYTFNTSCHGCHVSQYSLNYDLKTDTYHTTWREPGINCETCHGPGEEHIRVCKQAPQGTVPSDLRITRGGRDFSHRQNNHTCAVCHAKAIPLTQSFMPGDEFWDHFDLALLEHRDYYPDGRDLGENYTFTSWLLSPCVKTGQLDCLHCHTSSGRFRQKKDPNAACLPCHTERVADAPAHTRHKADSPGNQCIACHMPMTTFAGMNRSDHSMLPPTPAVTLRCKSPNACNNCHRDKDAAWADAQVRSWHQRDYQAPVLKRAELIQAARERDWSRLPEMLAYLSDPKRDQVFAASLTRLLRACPLENKWPAVLRAAQDPSPLVRAAALASLGDWPTAASARALLPALKDPTRLVRIRAAQSLAGYPERGLDQPQAEALDAATREMLRSLLARPDTWHAHYNVGNYYLERGLIREAVHSYQVALKLEPRAVMPRINLAMAYARSGDGARADQQLRQALELEPDNAAASFNLGLLRAEQGRTEEAKRYLEAALKKDPQMAQAAYNLGLLLAAEQPSRGIGLLTRAYEIQPSPKYALGLASVMDRAGDADGAEGLLTKAVGRWPESGDLVLALGGMYLRRGDRDRAAAVLTAALDKGKLSPRQRAHVQAALIDLRRREGR